MHVTIVTAFPEFFRDFLSVSIVGRAVAKGLIRVDITDIREFGKGGYRQIDDYAFGSGGMVMAAPQLSDALDAASEGGKPFVVYPSPQGVTLTQETIETLSRQEHVVIICGHYEGLDERFTERSVDLEVSIGDCVLTGGEIPAMAVVDAMSRLVPGVVGKAKAVEEDSFYRGMLDHPHYTRPASWEGMDVPEVLLSGNAAEIESWRREEAVRRTLCRRPDLLSRAAIGGYIAGRIYTAFISCKAPDACMTASVSSLCRAYDLERPIFVITDPDNRKAFSAPPDIPKEAAPRVLGSLARAVEQIRERECGEKLLIVDVAESYSSSSFNALDVKRLCLTYGGAVLFLFHDPAEHSACGSSAEVGTRFTMLHGTDDNVKIVGVGLMFGSSLLHLSADVIAAVALDRFLGVR